MAKAAIVGNIRRPTQPRTFILVWSTTTIASELRGGRRDFQFSARSSSCRWSPASSVVTTFSAAARQRPPGKKRRQLRHLPRKQPYRLFNRSCTACSGQTP
jgi:hypothetical protein